MGIQIAKKDIKVYKGFDGTNDCAIAPIQGAIWGKLYSGRVLHAYHFLYCDGLCAPGVHSAAQTHDAKLAGLLVWEAVIPAGTKYYKATVDEGRTVFDGNMKGSIYRAAKIRLVRQVKVRGV